MAGGMALSVKNALKIQQCGSELEFEGVKAEFVRNYFGLEDDLKQINTCISKDDFIKKSSTSV